MIEKNYVAHKSKCQLLYHIWVQAGKFDKQKMEERQELAKVFGEEAYRLAHNMKDDGSGRKIAVHAAIGGIMSKITGAGFASGAAGAGLNEALINAIKGQDPGTAQIVSAIVGAAAAKAVGGNAQAGASAAASGTKNNKYQHKPYVKFRLEELLDQKEYQFLQDNEYIVLCSISNDGKKMEGVLVNRKGEVQDFESEINWYPGKYIRIQSPLKEGDTWDITNYADYEKTDHPKIPTGKTWKLTVGENDGHILQTFGFQDGFLRTLGNNVGELAHGVYDIASHPLETLSSLKMRSYKHFPPPMNSLKHSKKKQSSMWSKSTERQNMVPAMSKES